MRKILAGTLFMLLAALVGWAATGDAAIQYPTRNWVEVDGGAIIDTVNSNGSWRDTIYILDAAAPNKSCHDSLYFDYISAWTVECPKDDNDVGVYVWWVPIFQTSERGSMLVRQNSSWTSGIPCKAFYIRGANATADSVVRYQFIYEGKPTSN